MHIAYSEKSDEFDRYALGDLNCFENLINNPKHLGIHIHRKQWENLPINPGSFWEWALSKYGNEIN